MQHARYWEICEAVPLAINEKTPAQEEQWVLATSARMTSEAKLVLHRTQLIGFIAAALTSVLPHASQAQEAVLSLVHPKNRLDLAKSQVLGVTPEASPHSHDVRVRVCLDEAAGKRLCEMSKAIMNEPLSIEVDCKVISSPIVLSPLCRTPCIVITGNFNSTDAKTLADRIRDGLRERGCGKAGS